MKGKDWFELLLPLVCAVAVVTTFYFKGEQLDAKSLAIGAGAMFLIGLNMRTKAERLFHDKISQIKKELDETKEDNHL